MRHSNIHPYLVGAQGALPVDAAGNPWSGSYVYNSGNLALDLLDNLMLESTGRLQKCRIYEMTDNKTARSTIAYLIVRDQAHENAFAKALESLGVDGKALPIPKTNAERFPEVTTAGSGSSKRAVHVQRRRPKPGSEAISRCVAAERRNRPEYRGDAGGVSDDHPPERREEFAPGLDKDPSALIQVTAEAEVADAEKAGR